MEISGYLCAIKYVNMQGSCLNNIKVSAIMFGSSDYFVSKQASKQASILYINKEGRKPFCIVPVGIRQTDFVVSPRALCVYPSIIYDNLITITK